MAGVASVCDEQVMGMWQVVAVDEGKQLLFAGGGGFGSVQAEAGGGAKDVRIDGEYLLVEEFTENDIGSLASDSWQGF